MNNSLVSAVLFTRFYREPRGLVEIILLLKLKIEDRRVLRGRVSISFFNLDYFWDRTPYKSQLKQYIKMAS